MYRQQHVAEEIKRSQRHVAVEIRRLQQHAAEEIRRSQQHVAAETNNIVGSLKSDFLELPENLWVIAQSFREFFSKCAYFLYSKRI